MKYFTPELYLRYNSSDDVEADRADEAWEAAIRDYQAHLDSFLGSMSPRVRQLAEGPSLHDAELLALQVDLGVSQSPALASPMAATISLREGGQIVHLDYLLWAPVIQSSPSPGWPFSRSRVHWLYDEVDHEGEGHPGRFRHRILLSDGRSIELPFADVIMSRFSPDRPEPAMVARIGS